MSSPTNYTFNVTKIGASHLIVYRITVSRKMVARKTYIEEGVFNTKRIYNKKVGNTIEKIEKDVVLHSIMRKVKLVLSDALVELHKIVNNEKEYIILCTKDSVKMEPIDCIQELFRIAATRNIPTSDSRVNSGGAAKILSMDTVPATKTSVKLADVRKQEKEQFRKINSPELVAAVQAMAKDAIKSISKDNIKPGDAILDVIQKEMEDAEAAHAADIQHQDDLPDHD